MELYCILSAQRQKRKKPLLGRPISHAYLFHAAVLRVNRRRPFACLVSWRAPFQTAAPNQIVSAEPDNRERIHLCPGSGTPAAPHSIRLLFSDRNPHLILRILGVCVEVDLNIRRVGILISGSRQPFCNNTLFQVLN